jgi:D-sedoheptulose 7-phosphate isomerase
MLSEPRAGSLAARLATRIRERAPVMRTFFAREAAPLARASRAIAERFASGGTLYAFGYGPYATDAAHVSVELIHPVIAGNRALPAIDASAAPEAIVEALVDEHDVAIAFGPPESDLRTLRALQLAGRRGAFTVAWPGTDADYAVRAPSHDPHLHQEAFEMLGHTLCESVHVFLEHRRERNDDVAASIAEKARDGEGLRERIAAEQSDAIAAAVVAICERLDAGGRILAFGNGDSATDANDFALDCVLEAPNMPSLPAISLAAEPAVLSAIANDAGADLTLLRQIAAQARPKDVAFAFSTGGGSKNVVAALEEARTRGLLTVALLGSDGGDVVRRGLADHAIVVRSDDVPRVQEAQAAIYHVMRAAFAEDCE